MLVQVQSGRVIKPCGGMVDTSYLGFENCRFKSCQGENTLVYLPLIVVEIYKTADGRVVDCNGFENRQGSTSGVRIPFRPLYNSKIICVVIYYLRDGMVDVVDLKSTAYGVWVQVPPQVTRL